MSARSLLARLGLAFGLAGTMQGSATAAQSVAFDKAPPAWVAYGKGATVAITGWLNADKGPAAHMREALAKLRPAGSDALQPLLLKLWMTPGGTISRIEAASSGNAQADADLRTALLGKKLKAPPKAMLLPMKLAIRLSDKQSG